MTSATYGVATNLRKRWGKHKTGVEYAFLVHRRRSLCLMTAVSCMKRLGLCQDGMTRLKDTDDSISDDGDEYDDVTGRPSASWKSIWLRLLQQRGDCVGVTVRPQVQIEDVVDQTNGTDIVPSGAASGGMVARGSSAVRDGRGEPWWRDAPPRSATRSSLNSCGSMAAVASPGGVAPLPPRYRFRDLILGDFAYGDDGTRVRVEFYVNENTLKERLHLYFIKNQRSSLRIRVIRLVVKIVACLLYVLRVVLDRGPLYATCYDCSLPNRSQFTVEEVRNGAINWDAILWVERPFILWCIQTSLALISFSEACLVVYLTYKGNIWRQLLSFRFLLEVVDNVPFIVTIFYAPLRNVFIPVFLNCWLAKFVLENMFNDLHRALQKSQSALSQRLLILTATLLCLIFTSVCGFQHFQRAGVEHVDLFESFYFVVVTLSTVGYGDFKPDVWPSQLFMVGMICAALIVLPTQFEQLAYTWMERQKLGGTYSMHRAQSERHVVVCSTTLRADTVMDFLNEFYAHPLLQDYYVVLLSPCEVDSTMKMILQIPMWAQRVIYIQGSALKDTDLTRARMNAAEACFMLAARNYADLAAADEHTILRSWAVRDFAPNVPQYVQIFRPENKVHVAFAEHVVCEDEFKYALLANNCLCPGASTLVTLLLHTSRGQEGQTSAEEWHRLYGKCSGNEIYHIRLGDSRFFGEYEGKSFTYASFHSHRKYGVALVGVQTDVHGQWPVLLNPGPAYIMKSSDICFYMNITKEENSAFLPAAGDEAKPLDGDKSSGDIKCRVDSMRAKFELRSKKHHLEVPKADETRGRRPSIAPVPDLGHSEDVLDSEDDALGIEEEKYLENSWNTPAEESEIVKGFPPVTPYIGVSPTLCYLLKEKKPLCCMQLAQQCPHCEFHNAKQYNWPNRCVILAADFASKGIYNFIVPLRAHFHSLHSLRPIVLLLERTPHAAFLDAISCFPLVYWMPGSIDDLDDLLRAGINLADSVVVVNKESSNSAEEDYLADCNTIVAVQTMFKFFPSVRIITELSQSSNMRFMQFRAFDTYALHLSKMEKVSLLNQRERDRGSHISYMFRLPFAAGNVFSASMLDTLLYQAFVKDYVITFVRLLLGVDQAPGSGYLSSMRITKDDLWIRTYGRLYQKLCSSTCEIPIGIYRTQNTTNPEGSTVSLDLLDDKATFNENIERQEISTLVRTRMQDLGLPVQDYDEVSDRRHSLSYVIINPNCDLPLEEGDIIFVIRPSPISGKRIFLKHGSVRIKTPRASRRENTRGGRPKPSSLKLNLPPADAETPKENGGLTPPQNDDALPPAPPPAQHEPIPVHVTAATPSSITHGTIV
ncbi:potassium channel subfamily T member 2-like isoform X4 [Ornithodoros turicata]|uniref:potassium channel subfamily T member 2-like isoform X4 n=1 Tax=Ornithodoros turicata TaxID=34597 RepID=UPI003138FF0B